MTSEWLQPMELQASAALPCASNLFGALAHWPPWCTLACSPFMIQSFVTGQLSLCKQCAGAASYAGTLCIVV